MLNDVTRLWQHGETGRWCWTSADLSQTHTDVPLIYEDELPANMSDEDYNFWFGNSIVVDGVRMGPKITKES